MSVPAALPGPAVEDCDSLCHLFDTLFAQSENTRLIKGGEEPLYLPADTLCDFNRVIFRHDYAASALHEIAHWCIAGMARRTLPDYGYWYRPDGRDAAEQREFESVEARPQALEWLFSRAAGLAFRPSIDNLHGAVIDSAHFCNAILAALRELCENGLPPRAARFHAALATRRGHPARPDCADFSLAQLQAAA